MDFGSEYVYTYEAPDFEYISDEEYEGGMDISDSDDSDDERVTEKATPGSGLFSASFPPPPAASGRREAPSALSSVPPPPPPPPVERHRSTAPRVKKARGRWRDDYYEPLAQEQPVLSATSNIRAQRVRKGDTNIISVKLDQLISPTGMHAGDPVTCSNCGAILSKLSKVIAEQEDKVWECEFCYTRNVVDIEEEERPRDEDITFLLEPALSTTASGPSGLDESLVIFCVDVSGSMCVTTEVPGKIKLRGAESLRRARMFNREREDQYLPRQQRDVTYVSRLQSVQAAIDHQLQDMEKTFPNRRVALITFSNEVTVIGDGKSEAVSVAGDKLADKDNLKSVVGELPLPGSIKTTRQQLGKKLFELEEGGPTALGPALYVSASMAAKVRGSKVILCTDGMANIGMGKLDNFKTEAEAESASTFYEELSNEAVENGVSISVITIKGTDCKLVEIGKMADKTGGQVNIVDPLKLTEKFSTILADKIVATNVVATFILHKDLLFFNEESEESKVVKNIGNATSDTVITFEYGVRTPDAPKNTDKTSTDTKKDSQSQSTDTSEQNKSTAEPKPSGSTGDGQKPGSSTDPHLKSDKPTDNPKASTESEGATASASSADKKEEKQKEIPFQLQIVYTDTEGAKALKLITRTKPVTRDRKTAERLANLDILATHTARSTAALALDGCYTMARQKALVNQRVAWRHTRETKESSQAPKRAAYKQMFTKIQSMENYLNQRQQTERATSGRTYSDDEEEEIYDEAQAAPAPVAKKTSKPFLAKLRKKRSEKTEDADAELVFKGKNAKKFFE